MVNPTGIAKKCKNYCGGQQKVSQAYTQIRDASPENGMVSA